MTSYKTAKTRKNPSVPCLRFVKEVEAPALVLDFGCGKGQDVKFLQGSGYDAIGYDPHFAPNTLKEDSRFDYGLCTYVLNVIESVDERKDALKKLCTVCGIVYITVRNGHDFKQWQAKGDGFLTYTGTFQVGIGEDTLYKMLEDLINIDKIYTVGASTYAKGWSKVYERE